MGMGKMNEDTYKTQEYNDAFRNYDPSDYRYTIGSENENQFSWWCRSDYSVSLQKERMTYYKKG